MPEELRKMREEALTIWDAARATLESGDKSDLSRMQIESAFELYEDALRTKDAALSTLQERFGLLDAKLTETYAALSRAEAKLQEERADFEEGIKPDGTVWRMVMVDGEEYAVPQPVAMRMIAQDDRASRAEAERDEAVKMLGEAHKIAVDRAFERDREADELYAKDLSHDGAICKMQGATAAVIANDILAVQQRLSSSSRDE